MKLIEYKGKIRFLKLDESFKQYDVLGDREARDLMQHVAIIKWGFPMTLYFEAYDFDQETILATKSLQVQKVRSEKRIITFSLKDMKRKEIPAFTVQIENEAALKQAFGEFFYVAEQNHFFALTKEPCITYDGEHPTVPTKHAEILITDYDGQGALLISNTATLKEKEDTVATVY